MSVQILMQTQRVVEVPGEGIQRQEPAIRQPAVAAVVEVGLVVERLAVEQVARQGG